MASTDRRRLIESFLVPGLHPDDEMEAAAERLGTRSMARLTTAMFTEAMDRRYGDEEPDSADVRDYARRLADTYGIGDEPVKPLIVEALIRASNGETDLLKGLPALDVMHHQKLIAYDIFNSLGLDEAGFADFVNETMKLLDGDAAR